jgi:acyl-CoA reductase-like NAD-dependent aldehyde dehydrogenase
MERSMTSVESDPIAYQPFRPSATSRIEIDTALQMLSIHSQEWVDLSIDDRIAIVKSIHNNFPKIWDRWVDYSVKAKGIANRKTGNDMDWFALATISRIHTVVLRSLEEIKKLGKPKVPGGYSLLPNGQVAARVFPDSLFHSLAFQGTTVDVLLEVGVNNAEANNKQAQVYRESERIGKVALVLGAGNASQLPVSDTFHKLFHDLCVVILKMNPVNSYVGPLLEECYQPLIDKGFLRIVYGGTEEGSYLVHHNSVDEIHMTGSDKTFETIVFGSGEEGQQRKLEGRPILNKQIHGELGCITPWVIVPGNWKTRDVFEQAAKVAFWMMYLDGYLCFAPRILVMHKGWSHRELFIKALIEALSKVETISAYYPGSAATQKEFIIAHPEAVQIGGHIEDHIPWTVIPNLDPSATNDICFRRESFSGLCGEVAIDAPSIPKFIDQAVGFLNTTVWGTLSATLVINDESLEDPAISDTVDQAITDLRYGTVALNAPGTWGMQTMMAPWGAYRGSKITDIQSGLGWVANFLMLYRPEKTIVKSPFRTQPYPFLGTAKKLDIFGKNMTEFEMNPSFGKLLRLFWSAIKTKY